MSDDNLIADLVRIWNCEDVKGPDVSMNTVAANELLAEFKCYREEKKRRDCLDFPVNKIDKPID